MRKPSSHKSGSAVSLMDSDVKSELNFDSASGKFVISYKGNKVFSRPDKKYLVQSYFKYWNTSRVAKKFGLQHLVPDLLDNTGEGSITIEKMEQAEIKADQPKQSKFGINKRFNFLERLCTMVLKGNIHSLIVSGEGGLGKSHVVNTQIRESGLKEGNDYIVIKGFTTPKALYRTLYMYSEKTIIFDDCDSAFRDPTSSNILKAALEGKKVRRISWQSERMDEDLPDRIDFKGKVIFITNMKIDKFPQALKSRAMMVDLSMTQQDKIERMREIIIDISPDYDISIKADALQFIEDNQDNIRDLNIRTLEKVIELAAGAGEGWNELAEYMVCNA